MSSSTSFSHTHPTENELPSGYSTLTHCPVCNIPLHTSNPERSVSAHIRRKRALGDRDHEEWFLKNRKRVRGLDEFERKERERMLNRRRVRKCRAGMAGRGENQVRNGAGKKTNGKKGGNRGKKEEHREREQCDLESRKMDVSNLGNRGEGMEMRIRGHSQNTQLANKLNPPDQYDNGNNKNNNNSDDNNNTNKDNNNNSTATEKLPSFFNHPTIVLSDDIRLSEHHAYQHRAATAPPPRGLGRKNKIINMFELLQVYGCVYLGRLTDRIPFRRPSHLETNPLNMDISSLSVNIQRAGGLSILSRIETILLSIHKQDRPDNWRERLVELRKFIVRSVYIDDEEEEEELVAITSGDINSWREQWKEFMEHQDGINAGIGTSDNVALATDTQHMGSTNRNVPNLHTGSINNMASEPLTMRKTSNILLSKDTNGNSSFASSSIPQCFEHNNSSHPAPYSADPTNSTPSPSTFPRWDSTKERVTPRIGLPVITPNPFTPVQCSQSMSADRVGISPSRVGRKTTPGVVLSDSSLNSAPIESTQQPETIHLVGVGAGGVMQRFPVPI